MSAWAEVMNAAALMALAIASVGLWTLRVTVAAQGRKGLGSVVAAVEAIVFAVTFSNLVTDLHRPGRLFGYAVGVAIGTAFGLEATERLTQRSIELEVVMRGSDTALVDLLHQCGWPATWHHAAGAHGDVTVIVSTVAASDIHDLLGIVTRAFPDAFWTEREISGVRGVRPSFSPTCR
jgi:uncharacterized protein YebE (UPF0316 family)